MLITTVCVVVQGMVAAEAAGSGTAQLSITPYTPWFVWGFWLTIAAGALIAAGHVISNHLKHHRAPPGSAGRRPASFGSQKRPCVQKTDETSGS
jgi:hypothetical protein